MSDVATGTVCIVCGAGMVSGKEVISLSLARGLRSAGWNPQFITSRWNDGDFIRRLQGDGFSFGLLRLGFISATLQPAPLLMTLDQMRYWPALAYGYTRLVAATAPRAVIHTNWHHVLLLLPFLDARRDIFWLHDVLPASRRYARMLGAIARRVSRIVCVSRAGAHQVLALGVPESQVTVVYNGLPLADPIDAPGEQPTLRLGIVGQIGPWKGHDDLLDALALLARRNVRVLLRIFGSGAPAYVESLKRRVAELDLVDRVEWCGFLRNQAEIFRQIDVCVVPSRCEEPLATSALEANGFGRPVICSSRGGLPEIVEDGVTGFVVDAHRPDQLARAIETYARRPGLVQAMGEAARQRAQSHFSLACFVERFTQVIEQVAA
jgi:glycosyltransferase involved in cell wall biosynthesis